MLRNLTRFALAVVLVVAFVAATTPFRFVLTLGDSLVAGGPILAGSPNWTQLLQSRRNTQAFSADNAGVGTYTVLQTHALFDAQYKGRGYTDAVILVGTNPLSAGTSGATVYAQILDLVNALKADGFTTIAVCTIPPRGGSASWDATKETQRLAANDLIRAMADVVVVDLEPVLGGTGSPLELNPSYRSADMLHLNGAGQVPVADAIDAVVDW
jgi:lysophospholipase L1-like esterase